MNIQIINMKKLLVLYVFHIYNHRVKHFIDKCIFKDDNVDFVIISNGKTMTSFPVPNIKNVYRLFRENLGYDFGGWSEALLINNIYKKYDNFIFVNSSAIGPFIPSHIKCKWTDIYINGLKDNVKLFGSTINAMNPNPSTLAHVQSYIFSMDKLTLEYLINCEIFSMTNHATTLVDAVCNKEVEMSRKIIANKWNIGSLLPLYANVDFTFSNKSPADYNITFLNDIMFANYRNSLWTDFQLVFTKGNRGNRRNINID